MLSQSDHTMLLLGVFLLLIILGLVSYLVVIRIHSKDKFEDSQSCHCEPHTLDVCTETNPYCFNGEFLETKEAADDMVERSL